MQLWRCSAKPRQDTPSLINHADFVRAERVHTAWLSGCFPLTHKTDGGIMFL